MNEKTTSGYFFVLGETKYIRSKIFPLDEEEDVVINSARYELKRMSDSVIEAGGNIEVDGTNMRVVISPLNSGKYLLTQSVRVGAESFKKSVYITVTER